MATVSFTADLYNSFKINLYDGNLAANMYSQASLSIPDVETVNQQPVVQLRVKRGFEIDLTPPVGQQDSTLTCVGGFLFKGGVAKDDDKLQAESSWQQYVDPTYVRIDIDALMNQGLPEQTTITFKMEEGFLVEDKYKYPSALGYALPQNDNYLTIRTPTRLTPSLTLNSSANIGPFDYRLRFFNNNNNQTVYSLFATPNLRVVATKVGEIASVSVATMNSLVGGIYPRAISPIDSESTFDVTPLYIPEMMLNAQYNMEFNKETDGDRIRFYIGNPLEAVSALIPINEEYFKGIANEEYTTTSTMTANADIVFNVTTFQPGIANLTTTPEYLFGPFEQDFAASANLNVSKINEYPFDEKYSLTTGAYPHAFWMGSKVIVQNPSATNLSNSGDIKVYDDTLTFERTLYMSNSATSFKPYRTVAIDNRYLAAQSSGAIAIFDTQDTTSTNRIDPIETVYNSGSRGLLGVSANRRYIATGYSRTLRIIDTDGSPYNYSSYVDITFTQDVDFYANDTYIYAVITNSGVPTTYIYTYTTSGSASITRTGLGVNNVSNDYVNYIQYTQGVGYTSKFYNLNMSSAQLTLSQNGFYYGTLGTSWAYTYTGTIASNMFIWSASNGNKNQTIANSYISPGTRPQLNSNGTKLLVNLQAYDLGQTYGEIRLYINEN